MIKIDSHLLIVAETSNGETALELIEKHQPDVAVLDVDMPKMGGFAVVRELRDRKSKVKIIFLTMHGEKEVFQAALDLDVQGYVLKDSAVTDIVAGIKSVAENRPFFSSPLSALLLTRRRNFDDFENENHGLH